jgi:hypothetical protein
MSNFSKVATENASCLYNWNTSYFKFAITNAVLIIIIIIIIIILTINAFQYPVLIKELISSVKSTQFC